MRNICTQTGYETCQFCEKKKDCIKLYKDKGKAIPLQAWTGPEDPRRLRLPDFKTIGT